MDSLVMGSLLAIGSVTVLSAGVLGYAVSRMGQLPDGHPAQLLATGALPTDRPVLVCLGDSITQGALGADWVQGLQKRLGDRVLVVNAGVGGQVTWDLRQRLDEVSRCRPTAVVLLSGSNDAVGALGGGWASFYEKGRPQAPAEDWFAQQYDALVSELLAMSPRLACITLPSLGEDPTTPAEAIVRRQNEAIRASAADHGADLLDLHDALSRLLARAGATAGVPLLGGLGQFMAWTTWSTIQHRWLGRSWDRIAQRRGLVLTADTIHPSDRTGEAMLDLIEPWARKALSLRSTP